MNEQRQYICTVCCKRKRRGHGPQPAIRRYLSKRIRHVYGESQRAGLPFLILSGVHGLLGPNERIAWYDHALHLEEVDALVTTVADQLRTRGVRTLVFYARPKAVAGWEPYYLLLERACSHQGVSLAVRPLGPAFI